MNTESAGFTQGDCALPRGCGNSLVVEESCRFCGGGKSAKIRKTNQINSWIQSQSCLFWLLAGIVWVSLEVGFSCFFPSLAETLWRPLGRPLSFGWNIDNKLARIPFQNQFQPFSGVARLAEKAETGVLLGLRYAEFIWQKRNRINITWKGSFEGDHSEMRKRREWQRGKSERHRKKRQTGISAESSVNDAATHCVGL